LKFMQSQPTAGDRKKGEKEGGGKRHHEKAIDRPRIVLPSAEGFGGGVNPRGEGGKPINSAQK